MNSEKTVYARPVICPSPRRWIVPLILSWVLCGYPGETVATAGKPARIALITDDPELESLLVAEFKDLAIVERAELDKITSEIRISGTAPAFKDAQEVLFVDRAGQTITARLTETRLGATITSMSLPAAPLPLLARSIAVRVRPYISAAIDPSRPRISLLGLRFETDSPENRLLERQFNLMLAVHLQSQQANVLERWRLHDLVFEKSLAQDENPFWSGATLLDGTLSKSSNGYKVRLRMRTDKSGETIQSLEEQTLENAVSETARMVLDKRTVVAAVSSTTESAAFLEEAKWLSSQGLHREAWSAAETAVALGDQGLEASTIRLKAAAMTVGTKFFEAQTERTNDWNALPADLNHRVPLATEAMVLLDLYLLQHPAKDPPVDRTWDFSHPTTLAVRSLKAGLLVLAAADSGFQPWSESHPDSVEALREAIRTAAGRLRKMPLGSKRAALFAYLANFAGFWPATPEEAIEFYREVLDPKFELGETQWPELIRFELAFDSYTKPPVLDDLDSTPGFSISLARRLPQPESERSRTLWQDFLNELAQSESLLNQADSLSLRWHSTRYAARRQAITEEILDFLEAHPEALTNPRGYGVMCPFVTALGKLGRSPYLKASYDRLFASFLTLVRSDAPIPDGVLSRFWILFIDARNCDEMKAREALAALDLRSKLAEQSASAQKDLRSIRDQIFRRFPNLLASPASEKPVLECKTLRLVEDPQNFLLSTDLRQAIWQEGAIWKLASTGGLLKINPESGITTVEKTVGLPRMVPSSFFAWGERFVAASSDRLWISDTAKGKWTRFLSKAGEFHSCISNNDLWTVSSGESSDSESIQIHRIHPDLEESLVASSRRRPTVHPLDAILIGRAAGIFPARDGCAVLLQEGKNWYLAEKNGKTRLTGSRVESNGNLLVQTEHAEGEDVRLLGVMRLTESGVEQLLALSKQTTNGAARFRASAELENMVATRFVAAWRDNGLDLLAWSSRGSPNLGANHAWLIRADDSGCRVTPFRFVWSAELDAQVRSVNQEVNPARYPDVGPGGLVPTSQGFVIVARNLAGFWFVPYSSTQ